MSEWLTALTIYAALFVIALVVAFIIDSLRVILRRLLAKRA